METQSECKPEQNSAEAAANIASAHQILKALQEKIGEHLELGGAITKSEIALVGKIRAARLTPEKTREIARKAVLARWAKAREKAHPKDLQVKT